MDSCYNTTQATDIKTGVAHSWWEKIKDDNVRHLTKPHHNNTDKDCKKSRNCIWRVNENVKKKKTLECSHSSEYENKMMRRSQVKPPDVLSGGLLSHKQSHRTHLVRRGRCTISKYTIKTKPIALKKSQTGNRCWALFTKCSVVHSFILLHGKRLLKGLLKIEKTGRKKEHRRVTNTMRLWDECSANMYREPESRG